MNKIKRRDDWSVFLISTTTNLLYELGTEAKADEIHFHEINKLLIMK